MAPNLSDLPTEILLVIITAQFNDAEMNTLARTSHKMYQLLNGELYRRDVTKSARCDEVSGRTSWSIFKWDPRKHPHGPSNRGHVHFVKVRLLKNDGINPNFRRCLQSAPLALAARGGHSAVVELLLAIATAYIDLNVRDLLQSDERKYIYREVVTRVARNEVDINAVGLSEQLDGGYMAFSQRHHSQTAWTPLTAACTGDHAEVANLLLAKGSIDIENGGGLLARDDLDANIVDNAESMHYWSQCIYEQGPAIVKLLLDRHEIDPNAVSAGIVVALMYACADGDVDALSASPLLENIPELEVLLDRNDIDPNLQTQQQMVKLILGKGLPLRWNVSLPT
ncbi:hypothetical protein V8E54_010525 [Elaphomyces granulatus]